MEHRTDTLRTMECDACRARIESDEFRHARVGNFYLRAHLAAVVADREAEREQRIAAARMLTHPSYPIATRRSAAAAIVRLAEPSIAGLVEQHFAEARR